MPSAQAPRIAINRPTPKVPAPQQLAAAAPVFRIQKEDATVSALLTRWGKDSGWSVRWDGAPDIAITGEAVVERKDFLAAADAVITDARAKGYPLKARAYADQVLEIRKADQ